MNKYEIEVYWITKVITSNIYINTAVKLFEFSFENFNVKIVNAYLMNLFDHMTCVIVIDSYIKNNWDVLSINFKL